MFPPITFDTRGLEAEMALLAREAEDAHAAALRAAEAVVRDASGRVKDQAAENLRAGDKVVSRGLLDGLGVIEAERAGDLVRGGVEDTAEHASYVHDGTGPAVGHAKYWVPPMALADWITQRFGISEPAELKRVDFLVRRKIFHEGTEPFPFLDDAVRAVLGPAGEELDRLASQELDLALASAFHVGGLA